VDTWELIAPCSKSPESLRPEVIMTLATQEPDPEPGQALERSAAKLADVLLTAVRHGVGPLSGAAAYGEERRMRYGGDPEKAIRRIIAETTAASATGGFLTGLGGFVTMPVTVPANLAGSAILNARMVAAIAHLRGWDIKDPVVANLIMLVVAGESASAALRTLGVKVGQELTKSAIKKIPIEAIRTINRKVGFMLLAKYGTKRSAVTLVKAVPFVGGAVGGTVDAGYTRTMANAAKKAFPRPQ
jgi:hypothetical protein